MGLLFGKRQSRAPTYWGISQVSDLIPKRIGDGPGTITPSVTPDRAMRNSAVWAALRLRADLVSTMPANVYRDVVIDPGAPPSKVLTKPTGILTDPDFLHWAYASQIELDRSGNSIGIIQEVDGNGSPTRIDLQASDQVTVIARGSTIVKYRICGVEYDPELIWHERQYVVSGSPVGLSPVAYAAYTLSEYRSVEQFVTSWFASGQTPRARLKNTAKELDAKQALGVKESWRASMAMGEPFVHGSDWEYDLIQASEASADWLQAKRYGSVDVARFFNVPAELIDANVSGQSVTYANISDRNLQLLIFNLAPTLARREAALSLTLPKPRYVKFDTNSLLRLSPQSRATWIKTQIDARYLAPSEARAMEDRKPYTQSQKDEFEELGLNKIATATLAAAGEAGVPGKDIAPVPPADSSPDAEPNTSKGNKP